MTRYLSLLLLSGLSATAGTVFTDPSAFFAALSGAPVTLNFDQPPVGTTFPTGSAIGGITFTYSIGGLNLKIVNDFDTVSGTQSLGVDNPGNFNQFVAGDTFAMTFATPLEALGLYFVTTADPIFAGDFGLSTAVGTALNSASPTMTLPDGGTVYFLGITSTQPFSTASIQFDEGAIGAFLYNVDNIVTVQNTPEPSTWILCGIGLAIAALGKRAHRQRVR